MESNFGCVDLALCHHSGLLLVNYSITTLCQHWTVAVPLWWQHWISTVFYYWPKVQPKYKTMLDQYRGNVLVVGPVSY